MKKVLACGFVLAMAAVGGTATLARADCAYHQARMADKHVKSPKPVAQAPVADQVATGQLRIAQADKPEKPAPQSNK